MTVTERQVATLRAQLAGDFEEHRRLLAQFDEALDARPYVTLTNAAFFEAADRRFGGTASAGDITGFVAGVQSWSQKVRAALDPRVAERVLLAVVTDADISDLDPREVRSSQTILLNALITDEGLDGTGLDAFLAATRQSADRQLRVVPTASTIVSASTPSTAQARNTATASPSSWPLMACRGYGGRSASSLGANCR